MDFKGKLFFPSAPDINVFIWLEDMCPVVEQESFCHSIIILIAVEPFFIVLYDRRVKLSSQRCVEDNGQVVRRADGLLYFCRVKEGRDISKSKVQKTDGFPSII